MHGLYWLTANLADRRPLLIAVDDVHWADEASLRWLAYLAPRLEGLAVAVLLALRPDEPASMGTSLLALRARAPAIVRPAPLSQGAVRAIVGAELGDRASEYLYATVCAASAGNPLYVTELLRGAEHGERVAGRARSSRAAGRPEQGSGAAGADSRTRAGFAPAESGAGPVGAR